MAAMRRVTSASIITCGPAALKVYIDELRNEAINSPITPKSSRPLKS